MDASHAVARRVRMAELSAPRSRAAARRTASPRSACAHAGHSSEKDVRLADRSKLALALLWEYD